MCPCCRHLGFLTLNILHIDNVLLVVQYGESNCRMCSVHVVFYSVLGKYLYGLVRKSYKLDCEFRSILG